MTLKVVFRVAARRELLEAAQWYEARRPGLGREFLVEIERAVNAAAEQPLRFPRTHREIRCVRVRRFPYSVFFLPEPHRVVVLAVFHARRNPLVWQRRA
jgi:toxin ParE1/3/4